MNTIHLLGRRFVPAWTQASPHRGLRMDEIRTRYAQTLGLLKEMAFQEEVCIALQQTFPGFQPTQPGGDGGIDGLADNFRTAFCCFGPDLQPTPKLTPKKLVQKIVDKFREDLERILELEWVKKAYVHKENKLLEGILGPGNLPKIKSIVCIVNCFKNNEIIGALRVAITEFIQISKCRFVESDCVISIWGPKEVATYANISQISLLRIERPGLFTTITGVCDELHPDGIPQEERAEFDAKFDYLVKVSPERGSTINGARAEYADSWSRHIILNQKLMADFPDLHARFESARRIAKKRITSKRMNPTVTPYDLLDASEEILRGSLRDVVEGGVPDSLLESLASYETGHLLGICPIDWRPDDAK